MHSWNFIDKTGMRFGKLVAIKYLGDKNWLCQCDCGNTCVLCSDRLVINETSTHRGTHSCGCGKKSRLTQNYDFFKNIDSEEKAYILGFLAADGTITNDTNSGHYTIKIVLQGQDKNILEKIKTAIGTNAKIRQYSAKTRLPQGNIVEKDACSLAIHNKELVQQLDVLGVTKAKSYTLDIKYDQIPDAFKKDFWRGIIEGDGSFGFYGKKQILSLSLTTSKKMCESTKKEIVKFFPNIHINYYHAIGCDENTMRFMITTQEDVYNFLVYIYEGATIYLDRKYKNYLHIKASYKS